MAELRDLDSNQRLAKALRQLNAEKAEAVVAVYTEVLKDLDSAEIETQPKY